MTLATGGARITRDDILKINDQLDAFDEAASIRAARLKAEAASR